MSKKKGKRDRIGMVLYAMYLALLLTSVLIIGKIVIIQVSPSRNKQVERILKPSTTREVLEPVRGNILDCNGKILAMSFPVYDIHMDCTVRREEFAKNKDKKTIDSLENEWLSKAKQLSKRLPEVFPWKTAEEYYSTIVSCRNKGDKYLELSKEPIYYDTYLKLSKFPLFDEGRFKGGIIAEPRNIRRYPYGDLASRTIGFVRGNSSQIKNTHIGIEGKFDYELHGKDGYEYVRHTDYGNVRNTDSTYRKAVDGNDVRTTLNIEYQAIADEALRKRISGEKEIEGGCLVLMEVGTGAIRAMVNLQRTKSGNLKGTRNYAIGRKGDPGSVFKTVTLMSLLSDGYIRTLDKKIPTNHGVVRNTAIHTDDHIVQYEKQHHTSSISVLEGFKISSNYVFATLALEYYGKNFKSGEGLRKFIGNIYSYKLGDLIDFDLAGMAAPAIPSPDSRKLTPTDLGAMGYGYATSETPLQILTFYNAIAAKGKMMKPYLVEDIEKDGKILSYRGPSILSAAICTKAVADTLTRALKMVTEDGTAKTLKDAPLAVAGKTGTARIMIEEGPFKGKYVDSDGRKKNQGTFVGFFPADKPEYSIICTIYSTLSKNSFYGGSIPASAVKEIVEKLYMTDPKFREKAGK